MTVNTRENRARRRASRLGLYLTKSRIRGTNNPGVGGFMIADAWNNAVLGSDYFAFSASLEDVEEFLENWEAREAVASFATGTAGAS